MVILLISINLLVFLDEFSTGMDPLLKRSVMSRVREQATRGRTIVLTTQVLSEAEELCDDILILNGGRQAARGDVNTLKLLSAGLYDVTVTFDRLPDGIESDLEAYHPLRFSTSQNTGKANNRIATSRLTLAATSWPEMACINPTAGVVP